SSAPAACVRSQADHERSPSPKSRSVVWPIADHRAGERCVSWRPPRRKKRPRQGGAKEQEGNKVGGDRRMPAHPNFQRAARTYGLCLGEFAEKFDDTRQ